MLTGSRVSLLWRILLSTSIAVTLLFGVIGWIVQDNALAPPPPALTKKCAPPSTPTIPSGNPAPKCWLRSARSSTTFLTVSNT